MLHALSEVEPLAFQGGVASRRTGCPVPSAPWQAVQEGLRASALADGLSQAPGTYAPKPRREEAKGEKSSFQTREPPHYTVSSPLKSEGHN